MTQAQPQSQRLLFRIGSITFVAGMIIAIVSTTIHPSTEDPSNQYFLRTLFKTCDFWLLLTRIPPVQMVAAVVLVVDLNPTQVKVTEPQKLRIN